MSVRQYLQLLEESDNQLKVIGLHRLNAVVTTSWPEIAENLSAV